MNLQRAKEIAESPVMANVTFNGERVYIQNVDDEEGLARVYPLNNPQNEKQVALDDLIEH